jgi:DNA-binding CsgD family transcriptional regulator
MYWKKILKEILNKYHPDTEFLFTHRPQKKKTKRTAKYRKTLANRRKKYPLGKPYPKVQFSRREMQCILLLLQGRTLRKAAQTLKLSPRTVEFYVHKMKYKLKCKTKSELIEKVLESEFLDNFKDIDWEF